jgi:pimeloyl-ACP methyl ester carboxylesterase
MGRIFDFARLIACRDELATNADLRRYTTADAAADYEAVLDTLNYHTINVWGASYGTRLALELARRMPQRVRTLTLDAVVPPSFAWPSSGAVDAEAALNLMIAQCEQDADCAGANPTFRRDVDAAFAGLAQGGATATVIDPHTGQTARVSFATSDLAYATRGLLYGADARRLPHMFRAAAFGRYDDFAQAYVNRARALARELATGVHLGVYCAEDLPFVDHAAARAHAAGTRIGSYLLDEYSRACEVWPQAAVRDGFRSPVRSDVPTLLLTGERDPVTPPWTAHEAARTLSRARIVTWPAGGHGFDGKASPACKQRIVGDFIATADVNRLPLDCVTGG